MDFQAKVISSGNHGLTRMQAHAHPHGYTIRPGMGSQSKLSVYRGFEGIGGTRKNHEEAIPLRIDLVPVPLVEAHSQQVLALGEDMGVALAYLLQEARRAFD